MHEYTCKECAPNKFYTHFAPIYDDPAYCPNCGDNKQVTYIGEKEIGNPTPELDQMQKIVELFDKCKYSSGGYDLVELDLWLTHQFSRMSCLITDVRVEVEK